jgi:predicted dehydrogenase
MKKWTLGVLGLGEGRSIISAALSSKHWDLINICDLDEKLCQDRLKEFGLSKYTRDYEELLKDPTIEVIGIYTPDQLHGEHIRRALEAGKHVICTKPLLVSLDEANALLEVQKRTGKVVFVGQSSRYFEPAKRQREDYLKGDHGEIAHVETHYMTDARWFLDKPWSRKEGFSWMYNFLIHALDLAVWYLPEIESVYGMGYVSENTKAYDLNVPDTLTFLLRDKTGKTATVKGIYAEPTLGHEVEQSISCTLRGTKGVSRAGYPKLKYYTNFEPTKENALVHDFEDLHGYYFRFENDSHHAGEYQNYIDEFAVIMDQGKTPKPDLMEGIYTLAIMESMMLSMTTNEVIKVKDILDKRHIKL